MNNYFEEIGLWHGEKIVRAYVIGFVFSLAITLIAYWLAVTNHLSYNTAVVALILLALAQFAVQVVCFLHLGGKNTSGERLFIFLGACLVVLILVSGSIWIMVTLNGRMAPDAAQMEQYMSDQAGM